QSQQIAHHLGVVTSLRHVALRLLGGLGLVGALRLVGGLRSLGGLGLVGGLGSATGGEAVHGVAQSGHSGVHGRLVVLGEVGVGHHSLSLAEGLLEDGHGLGGVAGEVDALGLADQ